MTNKRKHIEKEKSNKAITTTIGLALGSGSARGWAHIGVIRALQEIGVTPHIVCGCSAGSLVGGAYAAGYLDDLEAWLKTLTKTKVASFFDFQFRGGGLIAGERLVTFFRNEFGDVLIEDLPIPYAAVATDIETGREIWFRSGSLLDAVRASISLPGIFAPVKAGNRWLIDGGVVNPIPVSVCRAMDADIVIAVNLNGGLVGRHGVQKKRDTDDKGKEAENDFTSRVKKGFRNSVDMMLSQVWNSDEAAPGLFDVMAGSVNIMQDRITKSRMAGDPPDIFITPTLDYLGLLEFHRVEEAIEEGNKAVHAVKSQIITAVSCGQ